MSSSSGPHVKPADLITSPPPQMAIDWVEAETGGSVEQVSRLEGATTSAVHAIELDNGTGLVLRRHTWPEFLAEEPDRVTHEAAVLELLAGTAVAAPELVASDASGSSCDVPAVLMTRLDGRADAQLSPTVLAETAVAIASVGGAALRWTYEPYFSGHELRVPAWAPDQAAWERVIEIAAQPLPHRELAFIHRDFHPWNVLSVDGRVTGVVDWLAGCLGPWEADVAHCRLNLVHLGHGADEYRDTYERLTGRIYSPIWDAVWAIDSLPFYSGAGAVDSWAGYSGSGVDQETARTRLTQFVVETAAQL